MRGWPTPISLLQSAAVQIKPIHSCNIMAEDIIKAVRFAVPMDIWTILHLCWPIGDETNY